MPTYLTTAEAAELLGVTAARIRQLYLAGLVKGEKRGRDLLLDRRSVERARTRPRPGRPKKRA
jgi:excisionase family DNA binding protein